jgi:hypothetical protein
MARVRMGQRMAFPAKNRALSGVPEARLAGCRRHIRYNRRRQGFRQAADGNVGS